MKNIKIIRITASKNSDPQKITIRGVWGGQLDVDRGKAKVKIRGSGRQKADTILAYLPPFIRNVILEPDGFLINTVSDKPFTAYIISGGNTILDTLFPARIGGSNIWQCKIPKNIFRKIHKVIIN